VSLFFPIKGDNHFYAMDMSLETILNLKEFKVVGLGGDKDIFFNGKLFLFLIEVITCFDIDGFCSFFKEADRVLSHYFPVKFLDGELILRLKGDLIFEDGLAFRDFLMERGFLTARRRRLRMVNVWRVDR
jgi:hypothetical protein